MPLADNPEAAQTHVVHGRNPQVPHDPVHAVPARPQDLDRADRNYIQCRNKMADHQHTQIPHDPRIGARSYRSSPPPRRSRNVTVVPKLSAKCRVMSSKAFPSGTRRESGPGPGPGRRSSRSRRASTLRANARVARLVIGRALQVDRINAQLTADNRASPNRASLVVGGPTPASVICPWSPGTRCELTAPVKPTCGDRSLVGSAGAFAADAPGASLGAVRGAEFDGFFVAEVCGFGVGRDVDSA